jgi:hypothetical protein
MLQDMINRAAYMAHGYCLQLVFLSGESLRTRALPMGLRELI